MTFSYVYSQCLMALETMCTDPYESNLWSNVSEDPPLATKQLDIFER